MKKKIKNILVFIATPLILQSYSELVLANNPINDYLLAAQNDISTPTSLSGVDTNLVSDWVEAAQFRFSNNTPTDNVDIKKNALSYELRIKPKAYGQHQAERTIVSLRQDQNHINSQQQLSSALKGRYLRLIEYLTQQQKTQHFIKQTALLTQETRLIQSEVMSKDFNPEKLLDREGSLQQTIALSKLNQTRLDIMLRQLGISPEQAKGWLTPSTENDWLIGLADIKKILSSDLGGQQNAPDIVNAQIKLQLSQAEKKLIKSKQQLGVDLVRFEFSDRKNDELGFQVGINIPLGTSNNQVQSQYDIYQDQAELNNRILLTQQKLEQIYTQIDWLSQNQTVIAQQIQRIKRHFDRSYAKTRPFIALNLRKELLEQQKKQSDIRQQALALYINYLALTGQLVQAPLRNWIQHGTPELGNP